MTVEEEKMIWTRKDLFGLKDLTREEIEVLLETATSFKEISERSVKKVPTLQGKTIVNLFFEPSTRTRTSFEIAQKRLSADTLNYSGSSSSSLVKGETIKDMAKNIEALRIDMLVIRHQSSGLPHRLGKYLDASIINAGDGMNEHPTQALLDMFTLKEKKEKVEGLNIAIIGDIAHSRVLRSNVWGLTKLGANVTVYGPRTMIPVGIESMGVQVAKSMNEAVEGKDAIMMLRIQKERQGDSLFPSVREYARNFQLNENNITLAKKDVLIMHPGPINRGVEISDTLADSAQSVILDQVTNGLAVRMAVLYLLSGGKVRS